MTQTKLISFFLCIFRNFLCISKNLWPLLKKDWKLSKFCSWVFKYMSSPMQLSRPKFRLWCFLVHPRYSVCIHRIILYYCSKLTTHFKILGVTLVTFIGLMNSDLYLQLLHWGGLIALLLSTKKPYLRTTWILYYIEPSSMLSPLLGIPFPELGTI